MVRIKTYRPLIANSSLASAAAPLFLPPGSQSEDLETGEARAGMIQILALLARDTSDRPQHQSGSDRQFDCQCRSSEETADATGDPGHHLEDDCPRLGKPGIHLVERDFERPPQGALHHTVYPPGHALWASCGASG